MGKVTGSLFVAVALTIILGVFQNCTTNLDSPSLGSSSQALFQVQVNKKPATITAVGDATFEFSSNDPNATFECAAFGAPFGLCFSPIEFRALTDGNYTVEIRAVKTDGTKSTSFKYDWKVDRTALSASISSTMPAFTNLRTASVVFTGSSGLGTLTGFECKVDALEFQPCTSPLNLTGLAEGEHVVQVRSRESNGQASQPAVLSWRVDLSAPFVSISGGPAGDAYVSDYTNSVTFNFNASDAGASQIAGVFCRLNTQAETSCTNTATYTINADSIAHTFYVRATDRAGNSTTVSRTFTFHYNPPYDGGGGGG